MKDPAVLDQSNAQDVSMTMWSLAKLNVKPEPLLHSIVGRTMQPSVLQALTPQGVSNIVWAYATLGIYSPTLMFACRYRIRDVLDRSYVACCGAAQACS